jgi:hypothetical protein
MMNEYCYRERDLYETGKTMVCVNAGCGRG